MSITGHEESLGLLPPPIFVVGPPRSGTTLMAKILGRHSRIFMPGETHFFDDIYSRRRELGELGNLDSIAKIIARLRTLYARYNERPDQERVDRLLGDRQTVEKLRACRSYEEILSCFMELQMRVLGKARWGNNVPKDIFHVKEIISFYPDAKIVICVRDVRDFLLSYQKKWTTTSEENTDRLRRLYHPILTSLLWTASAKQILHLRKLVPPENCLIVHYEKLVANPETVIRDICRFIGEAFEENMLNVEEQNSSFAVQQNGIYSSSVGRWRRALTNEEAYTAQKITKKYLGSLGYTTEKLEINPFRLGYIWITLPFALGRAVHANKMIREPLVPYIARRFSALLR
jgi:Sulfotransferase family